MLSKINKILFGMLSICITLAVSCIAAEMQPPYKLRYFMQPDEVQASITPYGDNPAAGKYVQSGDGRIYYEVYGEGKPVFVFHGGGVGSPYELGRVIDELRKKYKVVVISSRGHGHSEIGHTPMSLKQKAQDMLTVMEKVTTEPAPIIGFSDGAYTACEVAAIRPEAVERIVAIGAGTLEPGFFPETLPLSDLEKLDKGYVEQMRRLAPEPERLNEFLNDYMAFWHKTKVGKELFNAIKCPVLFVVGDADTHAPINTVLKAHEMTTGSRLCVVPHATHAAFLDNFPVSWAAISQFIDAPIQSLKGENNPK